MKIVVTDGFTLNPGDLQWDGISAFGELKVYDRTSADQVVERCREADIVLSNKVPFKKETLEALPDLKLISMLATGYNVIDTVAAKAKGVVVCNVPGYGTASVAQHVFALLLELTTHVGENAAWTAAGNWQNAVDFCYTVKPISELEGKTFGIVGFGNIGQRTALLAKAFGMHVIYNNRSPKKSDLGEQVELETLFSESDVISLHCPLTEQNGQFVNAGLIDLMKPTALLINTARGGLINEADLAAALNRGTLAGAGLDVLSAEPPATDNPLLTARNCIITPHTAWISKEARQRIMDASVENIKAFLAGKPVNPVN